MDKTILEGHPQLLQGGPQAIVQSHTDNIVAYNHSVQLLVFVDESRENLKALNLKDLRTGNQSATKTIKTSPSITFPIQKIAFNQNGNYLVVTGSHDIAILDFNARVSLALQNPANSSLIVKSSLVDEDHFSTSLLVKIGKVQWHPLSAVHLVVLTSDSIIRIYNVQENIDTPEQTFRISELFDFNRYDTPDPTPLSSPAAEFGRSPQTPRTPSRRLHGQKHTAASSAHKGDMTGSSSNKSVVTLDFGKSEIASWQNFTVYLLMDSGEIYSLCPVIPLNAVISSHLVEDLLEDVVGEIGQLAKRPQQHARDLKALEPAKMWLEEVQGPVLFQEELSDFEKLTAAAAQSATGAVADQKSIGLRTQRPLTYRIAPERLKLQGPLVIHKENSKLSPEEELEVEVAKGAPSDLIFLKNTPGVLIRCYERGSAEALISFEPTEPIFKKPQIPAREGSGSLVLWESYNLRIPIVASSNSSTPSFHSAPRLLHDLFNQDRVFIAHSAGVHRLTLPWLKALENFTLDTSAHADSLSDLPQGQLEHLLSSMPLSHKSAPLSLAAVLPINELALGGTDILMTLYEEQQSKPVVKRQCFCLESPVASTPAWIGKPLDKLGVTEATTAAIASKLLPPKPEAITKLGKIAEESKESLQAILGFWKGISNKHVLYAMRSNHELVNRIQLLGQIKVDQDDRLNRLDQAMQDLDGKQKQLTAKKDTAVAALDKMYQRAEALLTRIEGKLSGGLSNAEKEFIGEMDDLQTSFGWYQTKLKEARFLPGLVATISNSTAVQLRLKADKLMAAPVAPRTPPFSERQIKQLEPQIEQGAKAIEKLTKDVLHLKEDVEKFYQ